MKRPRRLVSVICLRLTRAEYQAILARRQRGERVSECLRRLLAGLFHVERP